MKSMIFLLLIGSLFMGGCAKNDFCNQYTVDKLEVIIGEAIESKTSVVEYEFSSLLGEECIDDMNYVVQKFLTSEGTKLNLNIRYSLRDVNLNRIYNKNILEGLVYFAEIEGSRLFCYSDHKMYDFSVMILKKDGIVFYRLIPFIDVRDIVGFLYPRIVVSLFKSDNGLVVNKEFNQKYLAEDVVISLSSEKSEEIFNEEYKRLYDLLSVEE